MNLGFDHKTVIVTGAAHGFGRAIAHAFSSLGAQVHAWDLIDAELEETHLTAEGHCEVRALDVTNPEAVQDAVQAIGHVDILVNNAGGVLGQVGQPLELVSSKEWNDIIAVNLSAAFYTAQAVSPGMKVAGWGRIINISTGLARFAGPGYSAYASMKGGIEVFTRYLAQELGARGIAANVVAPGAIETDFGGGVVRDNAHVNDHLAKVTALGRVGLPDDIGGVVAFLCTDEARWINAQRIEASGGMML